MVHWGICPNPLPGRRGRGAAGREDLDVRMLGNGRPFVLEAHNARSPAPGQAQLDAAAAALAAAGVGVEARRLRLVGREALAQLKARGPGCPPSRLTS
jgi:tRNA U54 and U55 pseudouridine synthase Pus10